MNCANAEIKAGYGETVITPPSGVELCGYGYYLQRACQSVHDDLKARALCVTCGDTVLFLIVCDLIGLDIGTTDNIRQAIAAEHNIPPSNVLLACTHTHTGPATIFLRACGNISAEYMRHLPGLIVQAARTAVCDLAPCRILSGTEQAEPIGFNRRLRSFDQIDATVATLVFQREDAPICAFSYACHAVTLGRDTAVSADWPGAATRALEQAGYRCLCFQGFCGDIDPVCNLNKWGSGKHADLQLYGSILKHHVLNTAWVAEPDQSPALTAIERRTALPLTAPSTIAEINAEHESFCRKFPSESQIKFIGEWRDAALEAYDRYHRHPFIDNVPIQVMRLGAMNIAALPAEVFCEYGIRLRAQFPRTMTIGYANGNTGYWPTEAGFSVSGDYAAYTAPKLYGVFPYVKSISNQIVGLLDEMLKSLDAIPV
ncbi:MAG: neutral/alkaline non-lysosomal ceramidase N-terminal domain-containing protein [Kiritimatiellia bacterium]|jgi:neutral ceramidase